MYNALLLKTTSPDCIKPDRIENDNSLGFYKLFSRVYVCLEHGRLCDPENGIKNDVSECQ